MVDVPRGVRVGGVAATGVCGGAVSEARDTCAHRTSVTGIAARIIPLARSSVRLYPVLEQLFVPCKCFWPRPSSVALSPKSRHHQSMTNSENTRGRRHFLSQLAAASAVIGAGCAPPGFLRPTDGRAPGRGTWDDSWTNRVRGHEAVLFDSPEFNNGAALDQAAVVMDNYRDAVGLGDSDLATAIVMRHRGVPMALNDFLWDKYEMGAEFKLKDPVSGDPASRNPFFTVAKEDAHKMIAPGASLSVLRSRGAILLACNSAAMGYASQLHVAPRATRP